MNDRLRILMKNISSSNFLCLAIIAAGLYTILPFFLIAPFNQPSADDFYSAVRDGHTGFAAGFNDIYFHWSGRYFAIVIARINPMLYHSYTAYKLYPVILIIAFIAVLWILIRQLTKEYFSGKYAIALTAIVVFLYFAAMPSVPEGFYWFSGACVYQLANVFFMLLLAVLVKIKTLSRLPAKLFYFSIAALLCICITGLNEISLIITFLCISFFTISIYLKSRKGDAFFIALAIVSFVAAAFAILAPGNFIRLNTMQEYAASWAWAIKGAVAITGLHLIEWAVPILTATLLYIPFFGNILAEKIIEKNKVINISARAALIFFILSILFVQLFTVWVAGGSNIGRIENVLYLYFLLGWFFTLQLFLVEKQRAGSSFTFKASASMLFVIVLLFFVNLFNLNNNISTAYIDIVSGKAIKYNTEMNTRMQSVQHCTADTCYVPPVSDIPQTIFFTDIKCTADSVDLWMNKAYAAYMGAKYVLVTAPLPPVKTNMETIKDYGKEVRQNVFNGQTIK